MIRGVAAVGVCAEHLRNFLFVEYHHLPADLGVLHRAFYFMTGLGHQSVMIFFVLSGYFVGGSVMKDLSKQRFTWLNFGRKRLTRLYMVLIPALFLTLFWDRLGIHLTGGQGYNGVFGDLYHSGPAHGLGAHDDAPTFIGNVFFLQFVLVQVYGSNGPLWSLGYEFWYYALFPMVVLLFVPGKSWLYRIVTICLFLCLVYLLPTPLWKGALVWLMGCGVYWVSTRPAINDKLSSLGVFLVALVALGCFLAISKGALMMAYDFWIGLSFTFMLPYLIKKNSASRPYEFVAVGLSDISYTLYVVHFPLLAFFFFCFRPGMQLEPSLLAYTEFVAIILLLLAYATVLWWLFESRTDKVRKQIEKWTS